MPVTRPFYAICVYSWIMPLSRSRQMTMPSGSTGSGEWPQGCCLMEGAVWAVGGEVRFVCGRYVAQMPFVGDQCAVEEFAAASADPALDVRAQMRGRVRWSKTFGA